MKRTIALLSALLTVIAGLTVMTSLHHGPPAQASSHREAPLIAFDPQADNTDVWAFVSPDKPDTVTLMAGFVPAQDPEAGPNYYYFGDDVVYKIHIDNNGNAEDDVTYEFRFTTTHRNPDIVLPYVTGPVKSIDDPNLNLVQTYSITRVANGQSQVVASGLPAAPFNVGVNSFPDYATVANQAIRPVQGIPGTMAFAGPVDDPFWVDLRIFDLLKPASAPHDSLAGLNVSIIALQVPITELTSDHARPTDPKAADAVVGIWSSAERPAMDVMGGNASAGSGAMVQVSRLGMPLVNEVVIPTGLKDKFNASNPRDDAQFLKYVTDPQLAALMNAVLGFPAPQHNRTDLVSVFLTGVEGLNMPPNVKPAEMLRLNVAIPPAANPNRLGVLAGDNAGFPNGRRLQDDVVDIALQAMGGVLQKVPGSDKLSQGVPFNDVRFRSTFPYAALAHPGNAPAPANPPAGAGSTPASPSGTGAPAGTATPSCQPQPPLYALCINGKSGG